MNAKDMLVDFIDFILYILFLCFCLIFIIRYINILSLGEMVKFLLPFLVILVLISIKFNINKREFKKRIKDDNLDIVIYLSFFDKIIADAVLFLTPIFILLIAFLSGLPDLTDVLQAFAVLLVFYFWQKYIFNKNS